MHRYPLRLACCLGLLLASATSAQDALPPAVLRALRDAGVPADAMAAAAIPLGAGAARIKPWRHRAGVGMQPASTLKIVTAAVALDRLGPNRRGWTELRSAAPLRDGVLEGELVLKGGADPELGVAQFWALLLDLRQAGVTTVAGDLVVDRTLFLPARSDLGLPPFDATPEFPYNVIPDALQLAGNLLPLQLSADAQGVQAATVPPLPGVTVATSRMNLTDRPCTDWDEDWKPAIVSRDGAVVQIELQGGFPRGCTRRVWLQLLDRNELAERLFSTLWRGLGGVWTGRLREAAAPTDATPGMRLLARRESRPWGEVLRGMMKTSDNPQARLLFLQLGLAAAPAEPGVPTAELAARAVRGWFADHDIDDAGLVLDNGSGLSRSERISAWQLASVLEVMAGDRHASELTMSLPVAGEDGALRQRFASSPVAGWARLKTGGLRNVAALAGYVSDPQGRPWALAMMINHDDAPRARAALDALVDELARHGLRGGRNAPAPVRACGRGTTRPCVAAAPAAAAAARKD